MSQAVVTISELKSRLSEYLRRVRAGEVVLVSDRDRIVARIEPAGGADAAATDDARWLAELEWRGTIRRATSSFAQGLAGTPPEDAGRRRGRAPQRTLGGAMRFWDSSALLPLVVAQTASPSATS